MDDVEAGRAEEQAPHRSKTLNDSFAARARERGVRGIARAQMTRHGNILPSRHQNRPSHLLPPIKDRLSLVPAGLPVMMMRPSVRSQVDNRKKVARSS